jgi:hypothetical protein
VLFCKCSVAYLSGQVGIFKGVLTLHCFSVLHDVKYFFLLLALCSMNLLKHMVGVVLFKQILQKNLVQNFFKFVISLEMIPDTFVYILFLLYRCQKKRSRTSDIDYKNLKWCERVNCRLGRSKHRPSSVLQHIIGHLAANMWNNMCTTPKGTFNVI